MSRILLGAPPIAVRAILPFFLLAVACSSSSTASVDDAGGEEDAATGVDSASDVPSTHDALPEISFDASDAAAHDPAAQCPGCQVTKCLPELQACGASSACVGWLKCMNDCFPAPDAGGCQAACTAKQPSTEGTKLAACDEAKCHDECTP